MTNDGLAGHQNCVVYTPDDIAKEVTKIGLQAISTNTSRML